MTRRQFLKRAAVIGAAAMGGAGVIGGSKVAVDERWRAKELARRNKERPRPGGHWFTAHEYALVGILATVMVPSDEMGPGASEAGVVKTLDRLVATSPDRQAIYASGLLSFDELAQYEYSRAFTELTAKQHEDLLKRVDQTYQMAKIWGPSMAERVSRKATDLYYTWPSPGAWDGMGGAMNLFPSLLNDVLEAFYTSQVAWDWLGYDGPPFPRGNLGRMGECPPV